MYVQGCLTEGELDIPSLTNIVKDTMMLNFSQLCMMQKPFENKSIFDHL